MAGSLYTGNMGAGKTYGAVRFGIIPSLKRRQRVVTNIPINVEKMTNFLGYNLDGLLVLVTNEQVEAPGFWYSDAFPTSIVQPGDMVVIDEAWQFYGSDKKLKTDNPAFEYLRLHRKYTDPVSGFSSEVWYVTQDYNDLTRSFRSVCDFHLFMEKLKVVGKPTEFRVDYFSNCRVAPGRQAPFKKEFYTYDPVYFELYNSYASSTTSLNSEGAPGVEVQADDRMNFWHQKVFFGLLGMRQAMYLAGAVAVLAIIGFIYVFSTVIFTTNAKPKPKTQPASVAVPPGASNSSSVPSSFPAVAAAPVAPAFPADSQEYRLVGLYRIDGRPVAVLQDAQARVRYLSPFEFEQVWAGPVTYIKWRGKVVASWTGPVAEAPGQSNQSSQKVQVSK